VHIGISCSEIKGVALWELPLDFFQVGSNCPLLKSLIYDLSQSSARWIV
jgi:hypothetical protein